jgi:hypothetical protein
MSEIVLLDAVSVASIARAARDLEAGVDSDAAAVAAQMLPDVVADSLRPHLADPPLTESARGALLAYAVELDDIAEAAVSLDQHENEIDHQLHWWHDRVRVLEEALTGNASHDVERVRELALYRGRVSGATTMRRHYAEQRGALVRRHANADAECAAGLSRS